MNKKQKLKEIFQNGSTTFYNSSIFFPKKARNDIFVLYAFVRTADNFVDQKPQDQAGLKKFIKAYHETAAENSLIDPIISGFKKLEKKYNFPTSWTKAFFKSMNFDLSKNQINTQLDLDNYIYGSAEVIGLMLARILEINEKAYVYAKKLGYAFQLINFIRDIAEDLKLGRMYFPKNELKKYQLNSLDKKHVSLNLDNFQRFITAQIGKFKHLLNEASPGIALIPRKSRIPIITATQMYLWTAQQILKDPLRIYSEKIKPRKSLIYFTFLKSWINR
ncbi:MAG: phytoene/squalene synthase family protein [bacterium]